MPKEKRTQRRHRPKVRIRIHLLDGSLLPDVIDVQDWSLEGLQFSCKGFVKPHAILKIRVSGPQAMDLNLKGKVVWTMPPGFIGGPARAGVVFIDLKESDKKAIQSLIKLPRRWGLFPVR